MKFFSTLILILASFAPIFAQSVPVAPTVETKSAPLTQIESIQSKVGDKFLGLLYDKVEKYTALGENAVEKAVDVVKEQSPILVEEFITWKFLIALLNAIIGWIIFLSFFIWAFYFFKNYRKKALELDVNPFETWCCFNVASFIILYIVFFCPLFLSGKPEHNGNFSPVDDTCEAIKIKVAPRVYLIEQVVEFAKAQK